MKPRIAIGLTTYENVSSSEFGGRVYDCYAAISQRMRPTQVRVWGTKTEVASRTDFADRWCTRLPYEMRANRSKGAAVIRRGEFVVGPEWKTGAPIGNGQVWFPPEQDSNTPGRIEIVHAYSSRMDWLGLFEGLVRELRPAHAMLHLFTERELKASPPGDRFDQFSGPVSGERCFTSSQLSSGEWDIPDRLRLDLRRNYRFLPELAWANFLGREFGDNYDPSTVAASAAWHQKTKTGLMFGVTSSISDVLQSYDTFNAERVRIRSAFPPRFFHRRNLATVPSD